MCPCCCAQPRADISSRDAQLAASALWHVVARLMTRRVIAFVLPRNVERAFLVARLFLASLVAHNTLIRARPLSRLRHALLSAMLSALILLAFEIILFRHFLSSGCDLNYH